MDSARLQPSESRAFALHSCKTTVLSWARQAGIEEELRSEQGHHRAHAGRASVRLYSRDDVHGPLRLQRRIISMMREGWRPIRAQARGGLPPVAETQVDLPPPREPEPQPEPPTAGPDPGSDSSSGSSASASSDSDQETDVEGQAAAPAPPATPDPLLLNTVTMVFHQAQQPDDEVPAHVQVDISGRAWRTACGASLSLPASCYALADTAPSGAVACRRRACQRALLGVAQDL